MNKSLNSHAILERTVHTATRIHDQDRQTEARSAITRELRNTCVLERIQLREHDTRSTKQNHVEALKQSIATLGLIEPLVVDERNVLLAGGHRLHAIKLLKNESPDIYQKHFPQNNIPVRVIPFNSKEDAERALKIEVAENEQRRDYTPAEVRAIAERLRKVGYEKVKGRPGENQKPLMPALSVVIGKNIRTIQRYLANENKKESPTDVALFLRRAMKNLKKWQQNPSTTSEEIALDQQLPGLLKLIQDALDTGSIEKRS